MKFFNNNSFGCLALVSGLCFNFCSVCQAFGQNSFNHEVRGDSLGVDDWNEKTLYEIELLRLERWILNNVDKFTDPVLLAEVAKLKKEAEDFAQTEDYDLANIWLETIWELLAPGETSTSSDGGDSWDPSGLQESLFPPSLENFTWTKEVVSGVDLWRQEFNFTFLEGDSTFLEGNGNPFTGIRMNFDYGGLNQNNLHGYTFLKYSRDYLTAEADLRASKSLGSQSWLKLQNRFEGTSFYRDFELKYLQNRSSLGLQFQGLGPLSLEVEDEFLLRRYENENSTYPNYYDNTFSGLTKLNFGMGALIDIGYRNVNRWHVTFDLRDYLENGFELNWLQTVGEQISFSVENDFRVRNYTKAPVDTSFQDYWENYFLGKLTVALTSRFGTEIQTNITNRNYAFHSEKSLPDYLFWEIEPELYVKLGSAWRVGAGAIYRQQIHQKLSNRLATSVTDAVLSIPFEDYYAYGPTVSLEFFQINGLLLSLQESFLLKRYPNTRTSNIQDFNLYSDRNMNSLLLFLTWNISNVWQLNVLANWDDDRGLKDDSSDSQNTIVGIELGYSF